MLARFPSLDVWYESQLNLLFGKNDDCPWEVSKCFEEFDKKSRYYNKIS